MNIKRILLFSIVLLMIVSSLNMVSAGEDNESYTTSCFAYTSLDNGEWYIYVQVLSDSSENCSGKPIFINVTDSSGNVKSYNMTTSPVDNENIDSSLEGQVNITDGIKENETYTVSVYFPGDDKLPSMEYEETVNTILEYSPVEEEDTPDTVSSDDAGDSDVSSEPVVPRSTYKDPAVHGLFGTQGKP